VAVGPTRRAVLAASAAALPVLIGGCRGVQVLSTPPPPTPDVTLLRSAIAAERLMISRYGLAITRASADPGASTRLAGLLAEHQQHLAQLSARLIEPPGSAGSAEPTSSAGLAAAQGGPLPADLKGAVGALAADEQAAAGQLGAMLLAAPPSLAQLLASISASEATHVPVLTALRRTA
jgi:Ferritin-like domain